MVQVKNLKFLYISDDEMDHNTEFVSRNLVHEKNFVEFREGRNFTYFDASCVV